MFLRCHSKRSKTLKRIDSLLFFKHPPALRRGRLYFRSRSNRSSLPRTSQKYIQIVKNMQHKNNSNTRGRLRLRASILNPFGLCGRSWFLFPCHFCIPDVQTQEVQMYQRHSFCRTQVKKYKSWLWSLRQGIWNTWIQRSINQGHWGMAATAGRS